MTVDIRTKFLRKPFFPLIRGFVQKSVMLTLLNVPFHPVSPTSTFCCSLEKLVKCFKKCMFADLLSRHDGPRRIWNKSRYPLSYVNLKKIFYFHFAVKCFAYESFSFHHGCFSVFLMHKPACISLLFLSSCRF